ncbi:MAG: chemotaxis protein CheB [Polyangiaceae bacterium]|nr:chemotaxis protein CheB [Polyangiaceae bacterium]
MRILVVDDDEMHRLLLDAALRPTFPQLTLVASGKEALERCRLEGFDILVTDWMMPGMDGIELIRRIREAARKPPFVIMHTLLSSKPAREHAMQSGADEFLAKPATPAAIRACVAAAAERCSQAAKALTRYPLAAAPLASQVNQIIPPFVAVAIASSAGGPVALQAFLPDSALPENCVYFVVQHGPDWMHRTLVESIQRKAKLRLALAESGMRAEAGTVYFACSDCHLIVDQQLTLHLEASPKEQFVRPAADPLFRSVAQAFGRYSVAVILTGMGQDGTRGATQIAAAGGVVLAQDPDTAANPYMPRTAIGAGIVKDVAPIDAMGRVVGKHANALSATLALKRRAAS